MTLVNLKKFPFLYRQLYICIVWLFVWVCFSQHSYAQVPVTDANRDGVWVEVSASFTASKDLSFREGQAAVVALARKKAIEKATGFTIKSFSVLDSRLTSDFKWSEDYQRLIVSESNGKIINEETPDIKVDPSSRGGITFSLPVYRALVIPDISPEDPGFTVRIETDKPSYKVGENITITMQSSKEAYLTVFSIAPDGSAALFLPNRYEKDNFVFGNEESKFPDRFTNRIFSLVAKKTDGYNLPNQELFLVVATLKPIEFADRRMSFSYFSNMIEINRWLMKIPRAERAEAFARFTVRK